MIIAEEVYDSYIDLGAGNDKVMIYAENTQVELGAGNDLVMIQGYDNYLTDNNGDDYYVVSRQSQYSVIYDTKGNDTVYIESERQNTLLMFNVEIDRDNGGKIIETNDEEANSLAIVADNRTTPISTYASNDPDVQMTQVYDFFGKGKIERIELAEGYYVEYRHVEAMRQEIAAWLYEYTDYSSVQDMFNNDSNGSTISEFHNLLSMTNWQKDFNMGSNYQYHSNNPT